MGLDADALCSQPRKLRKSLKRLRNDSAPELVHQLRTRMRRFEAMADALGLDSRKNERQLMKALKPLRRRAGKVRDMDVLTHFAARPQIRGEDECSVRLLENLGAEREWQAQKLEKEIRAEYADVSGQLKTAAKFLDKTLQRQDGKSARKSSSRSRKWAEQATALALGLETELREWPTLNRPNLHPFRLKVKELRYVLQMAERNDSKFVDALGEVKDGIGEWHDWEELLEIGKEVLEHSGCKLIAELERTAQERFKRALAEANQLRKNFIDGNTKPRRKRTAKSKTSRRAGPAIVSASALAA